MFLLDSNDPDSGVDFGSLVETKHGVGELESMYETKLNVRVGKELFTVDRKDCKVTKEKKKINELPPQDFGQFVKDQSKSNLDPSAEFGPKHPDSIALEVGNAEHSDVAKYRAFELQQIAQQKRQEEEQKKILEEEEARKANEQLEKDRFEIQEKNRLETEKHEKELEVERQQILKAKEEEAKRHPSAVEVKKEEVQKESDADRLWREAEEERKRKEAAKATTTSSSKK